MVLAAVVVEVAVEGETMAEEVRGLVSVVTLLVVVLMMVVTVVVGVVVVMKEMTWDEIVVTEEMFVRFPWGRTCKNGDVRNWLQ